MSVEKVTFTLPEELVRRLEKVPAGQRSMLVKKAVEKELDREAAVAALKKMKSKAIWKEKDHPDLRTSEDFAKYRAIKSRLAE
jgi:metal-responsive CopG/Arc/MetJ family transcriptional regulator